MGFGSYDFRPSENGFRSRPPVSFNRPGADLRFLSVSLISKNGHGTRRRWLVTNGSSGCLSSNRLYRLIIAPHRVDYNSSSGCFFFPGRLSPNADTFILLHGNYSCEGVPIVYTHINAIGRIRDFLPISTSFSVYDTPMYRIRPYRRVTEFRTNTTPW